MYSGHSLALPLPELDGESDLHIPHQVRVFCLEIAESDTGPQHKAQYLGVSEKLMITELTQQALIVAQRILLRSKFSSIPTPTCQRNLSLFRLSKIQSLPTPV